MATKKPEVKSLYQRSVAASIVLDIYTDATTCQSQIVPNEDDLAATEQRIEGMRGQAADLLATEDASLQATGRQMLVACTLQASDARQRRAAAETLRPRAIAHVYTLAKPSLLDFYAARAIATAQFPEDNDGYEAAMLQELLPGALGLDDASQVDADERSLLLWRRLQRTMFPSTDDLVFYAKRRSPT
jgi:ABC-type transporter Mla subunit MlaD